MLGDVRLSLAPSFDSKRHCLPSDGLVRAIARPEVPVRREPSGPQKDSLSIPPASTTPRPYEDPRVTVSWIESDAARWLKGNTMAGDVQVKALVAADGRVQVAEVAGLDPEASRTLLTAVKRWMWRALATV